MAKDGDMNMLSENQLIKICLMIHKENKSEALNGDDIEQITKALKKFNGD